MLDGYLGEAELLYRPGIGSEVRGRTRHGEGGGAGGDGERLRGVPILTRGTRGTMRGSDPLAELLRRERANGRG